MLVKAKCVTPAWDDPIYYRPGQGPLPGGLYEIEHDGRLASLKFHGGAWVFEFDRTMSGTGLKPAIGGYVCKACGKVFDTINEIGTHAHSVHGEKDDTEEEIQARLDAPDEPMVIGRQGRKKGRTFTCHTCQKVLPNLYALRVHNNWHKQNEAAKSEAVKSEAVPA